MTGGGCELSPLPMPASATRAERIAKVAAALTAAGLNADIITLEKDTSTSALAAQALGCSIAQIAKSLVFRRVCDAAPVLAILSGADRADINKLSEAAGGEVQKANAAYVKETTGYEIGGVPPLGHSAPMQVFVDQNLLSHQVTYAAAGSPYAIFPADPQDLAKAANAKIVDIAE